MPSIAAHITPLGPLIDVFVGVSGPRSNALTSAGQTVPQPVRARLLVDTGASQTVIDKSALQKLGLTPTGVAQIHTPSTQGVPHQVNEYDVFLGIPGQTTNDVTVWAALLRRMPLTAMIRNLGKMTAIGLLKPFCETIGIVVNALGDGEQIRKSRVHPLAILIALKTYAQGHGDKGKLSWTPVPQIIAALDHAFYLAFQNVVPTGKRILLALDVSGSMSGGSIAGTSLTPREGAAALALMTASVEPNYHIFGFAGGFVPLSITAGQRLDDVCRYTDSLGMDGTDCSVPWIYAMREGLQIDAVVTITDNETWAGRIHPCEAMRQYRAKTGIAAKNVVVGMTSTGFTIADPDDAGSLDVVGFDAAAPAVIADFIRG